jgi:hypothetical protein
MFKKYLPVVVSLVFAVNSYSQIEKLTFQDTQDQVVYFQIKNGENILNYESVDGSILKIGDTLVIGVPTGTITKTLAGGYNDNVVVGRSSSRSKSNFQTIILGKPAGLGNVLAAMGGEEAINAGSEFQNEVVLIAEMRVFHKGSRKKPLRVEILLGEPNGRAFGINKYLSVTDYEKSVLSGEIKSMNAPLTRDEAIAKLKESKDLLDLGLLKQEDYDAIRTELTPVIMGEQ